MIVGYGHLLVLIKKQLSNQYRKASQRTDFKKKRESYLSNKDHIKLLFPQVSAMKLEIVKEEIRSKARKDLYRKLWVEGSIFVSLFVAISIWASNYLFV